MKHKVNLSVQDETRKKMEKLAAIERRSVSNLVEIMTDDRWRALTALEGVAFAETMGKTVGLKVSRAKDRRKMRELAMKGFLEAKQA